MADMEEATQEEIIKNVEKMLAMEKQSQKETSKKGAKITTLNMNEGIVAAAPPTQGSAELDEEIETITRKKLDVKADNINLVF